MSDIFGDQPRSASSVSNPSSVAIGDDLYGVSVSELRERIELLQAEITRTQEALTKKQGELSEAETLFGGIGRSKG